MSSAVSGSLDKRRYFIGNAQEMRFFTPVPLEAYNMGGIYHWRVLAGRDESNQLVLAVEQTKNVNWFRDPEGVEVRQIIMGHLTSLRFTYGQGDEEYETWDADKAKGLRPLGEGLSYPERARAPGLVYPPACIGF